MNKHIVITGTGRAGTTFLVELLTILGLDTGYSIQDVSESKYAISNAGLEHDLREPDCPQVVKDPWFCDYAEQYLPANNQHISHIIIPVRSLEEAASSRIKVTRKFIRSAGTLSRIKYAFSPPTNVPGGIWHMSRITQKGQEDVLARQLHKLLYQISKYNIPVTLLQFPELVKDPEYTYSKLSWTAPEIEKHAFIECFNRVVQNRS